MTVQNDTAALKHVKFLKWLAEHRLAFQLEKYLIYMPQHLGRAFSRAHFEQLDSMIRCGNFHGVPFVERLYICGAPAFEDIGHNLF